MRLLAIREITDPIKVPRWELEDVLEHKHHRRSATSERWMGETEAEESNPCKQQ